MNARLKRALPWLAGTHLFIALVYSSHLHVEHFIPAWIERPVRAYGLYSGAHTHFNYFAPTVVTQVRVTFKLGNADGSSREIAVGSGNFEADHRLSLMFNYYLRPEAREPMLEAWAKHMLATHPEAQWVQTRVEQLDIPTLEEVKLGRSTRWIEIGRYGATRNPGAVR